MRIDHKHEVSAKFEKMTDKIVDFFAGIVVHCLSYRQLELLFHVMEYFSNKKEKSLV